MKAKNLLLRQIRSFYIANTVELCTPAVFLLLIHSFILLFLFVLIAWYYLVYLADYMYILFAIIVKILSLHLISNLG